MTTATTWVGRDANGNAVNFNAEASPPPSGGTGAYLSPHFVLEYQGAVWSTANSPPVQISLNGLLVNSGNPLPVSGSFAATISGFAPGAYNAPLTVSSTSQTVALPTGTTVVFFNTGSNTAYVVLGTGSGVSASLVDIPVPAGGAIPLAVGNNTFYAAITSSGTTVLNVAGGAGLFTGVAGTGGGGSSGPLTANQGTAGSTPWPVTVQGALPSGTNSLGSVTSNDGGTAGTGINQPAGGAGVSGWLSGIYSGIGTAGTGISQPTGGAGLTGWLSGVYKALTGTLTATLAAGSASIGSVTSNDGGTAGTGISQPTGGAGLTGWLSGVYKALTGILSIIDAFQAPVAVVWNSGTSVNTATTVTTSGYDTVLVTAVPTGTITAGSLIFEANDGANWFSIRGTRTSGYNTDANFPLAGSTQQCWQVSVAACTQFRIRLGTAITGTSSPGVTVTLIASSTPDVSNISVGFDPGSSLPAGTNAIGNVGTAVLAYTTSGSGSAATTSGSLVTAGQFTRVLQIQTLPTSTTNVWLNITGGAATVNSGICVASGGGSVIFGGPALPMPTAAITAITDGTSAQTVLIVGG